MSVTPIVLLTDFGLVDAYVGMMRGVIAGIDPSATVIDLTHGIGPQDIRHGAVVLADSYRYFPPHSIFVAVVDPGVGTDRAAILLETPVARYLAPDNGLLTLICRDYAPSFGEDETSGPIVLPDVCQAWRLTNPAYWQHPVSATFHGRDVFAPVAAHLSRGVPPDSLGEPADAIVALPLPSPRPAGDTVRGQVIFADAFGNLVTDITAGILGSLGAFAEASPVTVEISSYAIKGLSRTFHDPPGDGLRALLGSHGRLEVVVVNGSAATALEINGGASVTVTVGNGGA